MTHVVEDRYFIVSIPVRESSTVRYYVHEDMGVECGYRLSRQAEDAAHVRDLPDFVRRCRAPLDADARRRELGTLVWTALHITERRVEMHEESFDWSALLNTTPLPTHA